MNLLETGPLCCPNRALGMQRGYKEIEAAGKHFLQSCCLLLISNARTEPQLCSSSWSSCPSSSCSRHHTGILDLERPSRDCWTGTCPPALHRPAGPASLTAALPTDIQGLDARLWQGLLQMCILHWAVLAGLSLKAAYKYIHKLSLIYTQKYLILMYQWNSSGCFFVVLNQLLASFRTIA